MTKINSKKGAFWSKKKDIMYCHVKECPDGRAELWIIPVFEAERLEKERQQHLKFMKRLNCEEYKVEGIYEAMICFARNFNLSKNENFDSWKRGLIHEMNRECKDIDKNVEFIPLEDRWNLQFEVDLNNTEYLAGKQCTTCILSRVN